MLCFAFRRVREELLAEVAEVLRYAEGTELLWLQAFQHGLEAGYVHALHLTEIVVRHAIRYLFTRSLTVLVIIKWGSLVPLEVIVILASVTVASLQLTGLSLRLTDPLKIIISHLGLSSGISLHLFQYRSSLHRRAHSFHHF